LGFPEIWFSVQIYGFLHALFFQSVTAVLCSRFVSRTQVTGFAFSSLVAAEFLGNRIRMGVHPTVEPPDAVSQANFSSAFRDA
jgi:hypothetical protein